MTTPLWTPGKARAGQTTLELFSSWMSSRIGKPLQNYDELHRCSVTHIPEFWSALRDFTKVSGDKGDGPVLRDAGKMLGALFFPNGTPNFTGSLHRATAALTDKPESGSSPIARHRVS
jgi:acetoacetyl-CoA synthetase